MLAYPQNDQLITMIFVVLPPEVQRIILPTIDRYAPTMLSVFPPHITLLAPFVEYDKLPAACQQLSSVCRLIPSFEVTLSGYGRWADGAYIPPTDPLGLQQLFKAISTQFPAHLPYGGKYGTDFDPHISVGFFDNPSETEAAELPPYDPITFTIDRLHIMYGSKDHSLPAVTYDVIKLGV